MLKINTVNKIYVFSKDVTLPYGIKFNKNDEIEIVNDVVYVSGYPLQYEINFLVYSWVVNNKHILIDVTDKRG